MCISHVIAGDASSESDGEPLPHKRSGMGRFAEWLGHWKPEYDGMDQNELMLQVLTLVALLIHLASAACSTA